jgi:trimethylamine--corrinoid protein Co-methyltransferase
VRRVSDFNPIAVSTKCARACRSHGRLKLSQLKVFSENELTQIHQAALDVLWNTGMNIDSEEALALLKDGGAIVDSGKKVARIPEDLVKEALKTAPRPSEVVLYDRNQRPSMKLGTGFTYAVSGFDATYVFDSKLGERRPATKGDVANFSRLADALPNIHGVATQAIPQDVPQASAELHAAEVMFGNTEKHLVFCPTSPPMTRAVFDMARTVTGDERLERAPVLSCEFSPTNPLMWERNAVEALIETARNKVPIILLPQPITGVTSPITIAGTMVIHNAQDLSGLVISQLAKRGSPFIYACAPTTFDMREATPVIGSPETVLMRIASVQLADFYKLPSHSISPDTDAHCHDEQNAWERIMTTQAAIMSGADMIINPGMFATGLTVSYEQLVIDDEIVGYIYRMAKGIEVNPETIATDLIKRVGPTASFLKEAHTLRNLKLEHWMPSVSCRSTYARWSQRGRKDVVAVAREKAEKILREHQPKRLSNETLRRLGQITKKFDEIV